MSYTCCMFVTFHVTCMENIPNPCMLHETCTLHADINATCMKINARFHLNYAWTCIRFRIGCSSNLFLFTCNMHETFLLFTCSSCYMCCACYCFNTHTTCILPLLWHICNRLYHGVEPVSMWFTHQGPEAQGCVNRIGTDTRWYIRLVQ